MWNQKHNRNEKHNLLTQPSTMRNKIVRQWKTILQQTEHIVRDYSWSRCRRASKSLLLLLYFENQKREQKCYPIIHRTRRRHTRSATTNESRYMITIRIIKEMQNTVAHQRHKVHRAVGANVNRRDNHQIQLRQRQWRSQIEKKKDIETVRDSEGRQTRQRKERDNTTESRIRYHPTDDRD